MLQWHHMQNFSQLFQHFFQPTLTFFVNPLSIFGCSSFNLLNCWKLFFACRWIFKYLLSNLYYIHTGKLSWKSQLKLILLDSFFFVSSTKIFGKKSCILSERQLWLFNLHIAFRLLTLFNIFSIRFHLLLFLISPWTWVSRSRWHFQFIWARCKYAESAAWKWVNC